MVPVFNLQIVFTKKPEVEEVQIEYHAGKEVTVTPLCTGD